MINDFEKLDDIRVAMINLHRRRGLLVSTANLTGDHHVLSVYDQTTYYPTRRRYRQACAKLGHDFQEVSNDATGGFTIKCVICGVGDTGAS